MGTPPKPPRADTPVRRSLFRSLALIVSLVSAKVVLSLASVKVVVASQEELFGWPLIGFCALAGGISVWLGPRVGLPGLWDAGISTRKRLLLPALVGVGLGAVNLIVQVFTGGVKALAAAANVPTINVEFPASLLFYSSGAIILETVYRLILIAVPLWLIANVVLRKRGHTPVFWALALLVSALEPLEQMRILTGHVELMVVWGAATYGMNVLEAHLLRAYGFLAPLVCRQAYYLVWHVAGGALGF